MPPVKSVWVTRSRRRYYSSPAAGFDELMFQLGAQARADWAAVCHQLAPDK